MTKPEDHSSPESMADHRDFLNEQRTLLIEMVSCARQTSLERVVTAIIMLYSVIDLTECILWMAPQRKMRAIFLLARASFEGVVNSCFILAVGEAAEKRAWAHANQKAYRDLERELKIGETVVALKWNGKIGLEENPHLKEAIDQFTSKKGREISSWTPESLVERIECIQNKYGEKVGLGLQCALMGIYRHASDIAHGTLFGAMYSLGMTNPSRDYAKEEERTSHINSNICMVLLMLGASINSMITVLGKEIENDSIPKRSHELFSALRTKRYSELDSKVGKDHDHH